MKHTSQIFFAIALIFAFAACNKVADLPHYANGTAVTLSSSATTIAPAAADSSKTVLTFSWSNPKYATDSTHQKFIIEMDSTGRNFLHEATFEADGPLSYSFTGDQLNLLLSKFGFTPGMPFSVDIRVTSSYANNNEQYKSNVVTVSMTPYIVPIALTASSNSALTLLITNAANTAVSFDWTGSKYGADTITYALQLDTAGDNFATPQVIKYAGSLTGSLTVSDLNTTVILTGVTAGLTKNVEFRIVGYLGTDYTRPAVFSNILPISITTYLPFLYLYVPGGYQNWNPGGAPTLVATIPDLNNYEGYIYIPSGIIDLGFKINNSPDWNHISYGDAGGGKLSTSGGNINWPSASAYYYLTANPTALTWAVLPVTWAIIGDATPKGWDSDTPMTYDAVNNVWVINSVPLTANNLKFRANGTWSDPHFPGGNANLGGSLNGLNYNGSNISISAPGNYKIVLDLSHPLKYTATITRL